MAAEGCLMSSSGALFEVMIMAPLLRMVEAEWTWRTPSLVDIVVNL